MKWNRTGRILAGAALLIAPALSFALNGGEGLAGTPHDFTASGSGDVKFVANTGNVPAIGVCTFCHTPHKAQSTNLLWNHTLSANTFSWSDASTTTAGTTLPSFTSQTYRGPSVKCLSCHDGSVAVGDIAWYMEAPRTGTAALDGTHLDGVATNIEFNIATKTGDMKGNHPIGIPYPGGVTGTATTYNGIVSGAGINSTEFVPNPVSVNVGAGAATFPANIRLFTDDGKSISAIPPGTVKATNMGVECSSCHDPHNKQSTDDLFLRGKIAGNTATSGYICLQCHVK
jgi:hypothetical protein